MARGALINNYHFKVIKYDIDNNIIEIKFYRTHKEICIDFNCSKNTIYQRINHPSKNSRIFKNIHIEQIRIPIRIMIDNPEAIDKLEHNLIVTAE